MEAALLKGVYSGGVATKIVVLAIGSSVFLDEDELRGVASPPQNRTVIRVETFDDLPNVEIQLRNATCQGK